MLKIISVTIATISLCLSLTAPSPAEERNWSQTEARLTIEDFIKLYLTCHLESYQTTEKLRFRFIPGQSPDQAVLYLVKPVVVPVADLPTRADLTGSLKQKALLYKSHVAKVLADSSIKTRWPGANTRDNLIILFVDSHAPEASEDSTLGIMNRGKLIFEKEALKTELSKVKKRLGSAFSENE